MKTLTLIAIALLIILGIEYISVSYELGQVKNSPHVESCESAYDKGVWDTKAKYNVE